MKTVRYTPIGLTILLLLLSLGVQAQSGGNFVVTQTVIGSGGDAGSGGPFALSSTIAQPLSGSASAPPFSLQAGFWTTPTLAPTAASVTITGRVETATGAGVRNAVLTVITSRGQMLVTRTNAFGYYMIENLTAGDNCVISVSARNATFSQATRVFTLVDQLTSMDFIADPR